MATAVAPEVPFKRKEKVVATTDELPGVPEGTTGKILLTNGFAWTRYRVLFENGVDIGTIDRRFLARPAEYTDLQERRANGELDGAGAGAAGGTAAADEGPAALEATDADKVVNGVSVPGHLITRSADRRQALSA